MNLTIPKVTNTETDKPTVKADAIIEVGKSGITQTLDEVTFNICVVLVWVVPIT